ncbi:MAG: hypothetical protein RJA29_406 [Pseudomonadota bacterium]
MDIIENLRTFIAVVETGNFTGASRKLKIAVPVVKKRIDHLEAQAGVQLFERSTRRMTLTDAGRRHLLKTRAAVDQVDQLLAQMALKPNRAYFGKLINTFSIQHPGVSLDVRFTHRSENPIEESLDVSIEVEPVTWPGVVHFELGTSKRQVVASPSYLAKRGTPTVPGDLHHHDIINYETRGLTWTFEGKTGPLVVQIEPRITSNNAFYLVDATCSGNGICLMSNYVIKPFVQRGELVTVLDDYPIPDLSARMHIPENRLEFTHVQALRTHLLSSMKTSELLTQASSP